MNVIVDVTRSGTDFQQVCLEFRTGLHADEYACGSGPFHYTFDVREPWRAHFAGALSNRKGEHLAVDLYWRGNMVLTAGLSHSMLALTHADACVKRGATVSGGLLWHARAITAKSPGTMTSCA